MRARAWCVGILAAGCALTAAGGPREVAGPVSAPITDAGPTTLVTPKDESGTCSFDGGMILRRLESRACAGDDACEVFRPRTAFEAFGCCIPVARATLDSASRDPDFVREFQHAVDSCGYLKVQCGYPCDSAMCHNGTCRLRLGDGGVNLGR